MDEELRFWLLGRRGLCCLLSGSRGGRFFSRGSLSRRGLFSRGGYSNRKVLEKSCMVGPLVEGRVEKG